MVVLRGRCSGTSRRYGRGNGSSHKDDFTQERDISLNDHNIKSKHSNASKKISFANESTQSQFQIKFESNF